MQMGANIIRRMLSDVNNIVIFFILLLTNVYVRVIIILVIGARITVTLWRVEKWIEQRFIKALSPNCAP